MKRVITALAAMAAVAVLVLWVPAVKHTVVTPTVVHAQNSNGGCSVANLNGPYAFAAEGTLLTSIRPSWALTIFRTIASPSPDP